MPDPAALNGSDVIVALLGMDHSSSLVLGGCVHYGEHWVFHIARLDPKDVGQELLTKLSDLLDGSRGNLVGLLVAQAGYALVLSCGFQDGLTGLSAFKELSQSFSARVAQVAMKSLHCSDSFHFGVGVELDQLPLHSTLFIHRSGILPALRQLRGKDGGSQR